MRGPELFGEEVGDALLRLEGSGDAREDGGLGEDGVLAEMEDVDETVWRSRT